jgi:hypothetical protein
MSKPLLVIIALLVAGGVYGYISAVKNENPYPAVAQPGMPPEDIKKVQLGKTWQPSPAWLPAYLVATVPHWTKKMPNPRGLPGIPEAYEIVGYGLENRREAVDKDGPKPKWTGYQMRHRLNYRLTSMTVGAAAGLIIAIIIAASAGWITLRKPPKEEEAEPKATPKPLSTWP